MLHTPPDKSQQPSPFLRIQVTAHSSNREKSRRTVRRTEVLQEALHVQPEVHRPGKIVWVCVDPPDDLRLGEENREGTVRAWISAVAQLQIPRLHPAGKPHATPKLILDQFNLAPRTQPSFLLLSGQACHLQAVLRCLTIREVLKTSIMATTLVVSPVLRQFLWIVGTSAEAISATQAKAL